MTETPGFRPLYQQVREMFVRRIADRTWPPGEALPSEQALAVELGVSQGTVRKALDSLAAENLVERRQGKGTYITEVTPARSLFKFFRISRPGGQRLTPASEEASTKRRRATKAESERLDMEPNESVVEIRRVRLVDGAPAILETIAVPANRFPDLDKRPIPNTIYALYQSDYGINVLSANEELRAVAAGPADAKALRLPLGAPLLEISRTAFDIDGKPIEWRRSRCDTRHLVYAVTLR
jgi:GntR family transcriptional regulator